MLSLRSAWSNYSSWLDSWSVFFPPRDLSIGSSGVSRPTYTLRKSSRMPDALQRTSTSPCAAPTWRRLPKPPSHLVLNIGMSRALTCWFGPTSPPREGPSTLFSPARRSGRKILSQFPNLGSPGELGNRSEEHTSELQSLRHIVCRLLLEKKNTTIVNSIQE